MTDEPRFSGHTAAETIDLILKNCESLEDAGAKLSKHEKHLASLIEDIKKEMEEAFSSFLDKLGLDSDVAMADAERDLRALELREGLKTIRKGIEFFLNKSKEGVELLKVHGSVFNDTISAETIPCLRTLIDGVERNYSLISHPDLVVDKLNALVAAANRGFDREMLIKNVVDDHRYQEQDDSAVKGAILASAETIDALYKKLLASKNYAATLAHEGKKIKNELAILHDEAQEVGLCTKINWIGSQTDCKKLVGFLLRNGYIDAQDVNKFIATHFTFKGEVRSAKQIGGLHPDRDGGIDEIPSAVGMHYLKIPGKRA